MIEKPFRGKDLTGEKIGRLTVLGIVFVRPTSGPSHRIVKWRCACDCGNTKEIRHGELFHGKTQSCGCLHNELLAKQSTKHGCAGRGKKHPLYERWQGMIARCENPNNKAYKWYGGKGIKVCERWRDFSLFLEDMESSFKPGLTIERKDPNGNYEKSNCVWADTETQRNNMSSNVLIERNGETHTIAEWGRKVGLNFGCLHQRIRNGWPIEAALSTPKLNRKSPRLAYLK